MGRILVAVENHVWSLKSKLCINRDIDCFTEPLHSLNGKHLSVVRAVQWDRDWSLKNGGNSHWSNAHKAKGH